MKQRVTGRFAAFADFDLEAYLCAELPAARCAELERARLSDAALSAYLAEREQARAEFTAAHPLRIDFAAAADDTASVRRAHRPLRWLLAASVAAPAFAVALWWASGTSNATGRETSGKDRAAALHASDSIRIKGSGIAAELYVKRGERVFRPRPGEPLKSGDRVRLSIDAASAGFLSLLARDEHGAVSVYYDRLPVQPGHFTVPDSLLLDASTSDELWLVVVAGQARPADHYAAAFAAGKPVDANHVLLTVHKEKP